MKKVARLLVSAMLLVVMAVSLCSCGIPSDPEKAKSNLTSKEYAVEDGVSAAAIKAVFTFKYGIDFYDKIESVIFAVSKDGKDNVLIIYCKDDEAAKRVNGDIKELYKSVCDAAKENGNEADAKSGKSGKVVYIGTSAGVKAAG